jgi:hypothetical protein
MEGWEEKLKKVMGDEEGGESVFTGMSEKAQEIFLKVLGRRMGHGMGRRGILDKVMEKVLARVEVMFVDQQSVPYIRWKESARVGGMPIHKPVMGLTGRDIRSVISGMGFKEHQKIMRGGEINAVVELLQSIAICSGERYDLHLRSAYHSIPAIELWYDLSNWRAVHVDGSGWEVVNYPPPLFRSYNHQRPQVEPVQVEDMEIMDEKALQRASQRVTRYFPVGDANSRLMLLIYITTAFLPHIPRPVLVLSGAKGSGKTVMFRLLRELIDPSEPACLDLHYNKGEMVQVAAHNYCLYVDNMSDLPGWMSDFLCRVCTGEGFSKRALYSDDTDYTYSFKRLVGYNGIYAPKFRSDLFDRILLFNLPAISQHDRKTEEEIFSQFLLEKPYILGIIFTVISRAIASMEAGTVSNVPLPRLADFARWGEAIARCFGYPDYHFLKEYHHRIRGIHEMILEENPLAACLIAYMEDKGNIKDSATFLFNELRVLAKEKGFKEYPRDAGWFVRRLKEIQVDLKAIGLHIVFSRSAAGSTIEITRE